MPGNMDPIEVSVPDEWYFEDAGLELLIADGSLLEDGEQAVLRILKPPGSFFLDDV